MFIVPDNILESLTCDFCHKYLSVKKVTIIKLNGMCKKMCGRCENPIELRIKPPRVVSYLYGFLTENVLYKCINRFEGCEKLLTNDEVRQHETCCSENYHICFICKFNDVIKSGTFKNTAKIKGYEISYHLKKEHEQSFLAESVINENLNELKKWNVFYYIKEDHIFFIFLKFKRRDQVFLFNVFYIGGGQQEKVLQMNEKIRIGSGEMERTLQFQSKTCTKEVSTIIKVGQLLMNNPKVVIEIDFLFSHSTLMCTHIEQIPNDALKNYRKPRYLKVIQNVSNRYENFLNDSKTKLIKKFSTGEEFEINVECILCQNISANNIFVTDCDGKYKNLLCRLCAFVYDSPYVDIKHFFDFNIMDKFKFSCIWDCNTSYDVYNIGNHEFQCKNVPVQKCPIATCYYHGTYEAIKQHLFSIHEDKNCFQNDIIIQEDDLRPCLIKTFYVILNQADIIIKMSANRYLHSYNCIEMKLELNDPYQNYTIIEAVIFNGPGYLHKLNVFSKYLIVSDKDLPIRVHFIPKLLTLF